MIDTSCKWPTVFDINECDDVKCWRCYVTGYNDQYNASCAACRIEDGHVYCPALTNAFVGKIAEEDGEK